MEKRPISRTGFDNLIKELKDLKEVQRPEILKTVQWARSLGDLSENADYSAAKEKQRQIEEERIRLRELKIPASEEVNEILAKYEEHIDRGMRAAELLKRPNISYKILKELDLTESEVEKLETIPYYEFAQAYKKVISDFNELKQIDKTYDV